MSEHDRIRVHWPDHLGLPRGKYLPARLAAQGTNHCAAVFGTAYDRELVPAPGSFLLDGLPDVTARFERDDVRPGWEDDHTGVAVGHFTMHGEDFVYAPRYALQRAVADWRVLGYNPQVGLELEAYINGT